MAAKSGKPADTLNTNTRWSVKPADTYTHGGGNTTKKQDQMYGHPAVAFERKQSKNNAGEGNLNTETERYAKICKYSRAAVSAVELDNQ
ncbi:hypothetical protein BY996DRAFT_6591799 [Phakopsora pachyrhizi]|nr:hypothetical protein BY996DRAFT_6591799 [Phakopsora pachyrhizi]